MKPKLVDKKLRKDTPSPGSPMSGVIHTGSGVKKTPPTSPTKSATRTSLRQQHIAPESGPLPGPGSWEKFDSKIELEQLVPAGYTSKITSHLTPEGVVCKKRWKYRAGPVHRELWGFYAERGVHHFYPGQIIRAIDAHPQCDFNVGLEDRNTQSHKDGPVIAKKRPMVVLWKTHSAVLCLPLRTLGESKAMETYPERWYEYISVTTESDTEWKGQTPHAGPPLLYIPNPKQTEDDGLKDRCFISLTAPTLINIASEINMDLGRLSGSALCRLIQAYMYSQHQHKQKTYEEFGEWANLPDPEEWWANKDPVWKLREAKMNNKLPVVVDKKTNVYSLQ